ncbi:MAG: 50S ribosomal protein L24 [Candidatus Aenigmarchaeota archaeon]|nr:50S ribosomal protein L24 [Candidatus Aenigmarchaeota archaeon]
MKNEWSSSWISSRQPRKQRKYLHNAPLHVKRKFLSAGLSPALRERYGRRSMVIRKGDDVVIMRGSLKGKKGTVERVSIEKGKIYLEGIKSKKVDGSEVGKPITPSNVQIVKLSMEDKRRQAVLERSPKKRPAAKKEKGE